jgi:hypothetical protein
MSPDDPDRHDPDSEAAAATFPALALWRLGERKEANLDM